MLAIESIRLRTTTLLLIIHLLMIPALLPVAAHAYDEQWAIVQAKAPLSDTNLLLFEYVRRDRGELFANRNLDMLRMSWGTRWESWSFLLGAAYLDFNTGSDERRVHQFAIHPIKLIDALSGFVRLGLEQRSFIDDAPLYLRARIRMQLNLLPQDPVGITGYNESLYVFDGRTRFATGFNENRAGLGIRYITKTIELYGFHTVGNLRTLRSSDRVEWLQIQMALNF